jgi:hypothetical protein
VRRYAQPLPNSAGLPPLARSNPEHTGDVPEPSALKVFPCDIREQNLGRAHHRRTERRRLRIEQKGLGDVQELDEVFVPLTSLLASSRMTTRSAQRGWGQHNLPWCPYWVGANQDADEALIRRGEDTAEQPYRKGCACHGNGT